MTATLDGVSCKKPVPTAEAEAARELVRLARERDPALTGPDGLLKQLTKTVIETALDEEMTGHLGYEKHDPAGQGAGSGNVRNGSRPEQVLTDSTGQVGIEVPRHRAGTFEPQIVKKRQRRLTGVDEIVLSLYAKGLTTGEISAHFAEIYSVSVSKQTVSRIADKVIEEMQAWQNRQGPQPADQVSQRQQAVDGERAATVRDDHERIGEHDVSPPSRQREQLAVPIMQMDPVLTPVLAVRDELEVLAEKGMEPVRHPHTRKSDN